MTPGLAAIANGVLLGVCVGRHDGTGGIGATVSGKSLVGCRNSRLERVDRQNPANHARGGDQDLLGLAADNLRGNVAGLASTGKAGLARSGIGVAGVDRNAGNDAVTLVSAAQVGAAHLHGGRTKTVGRKHARDGARFIGYDERIVQTLGVLAKTSVNACGLKASRGRNAAVDGTDLHIDVLCIHRLCNSLMRNKKRASVGAPCRS